MLGQNVEESKDKGKATESKFDQDGFKTIDIGKGDARETDEQDLGAQPGSKQKKRNKPKETLASVKAKLQRTKEIKETKEPMQPRFGLGIFHHDAGRPDPAHRELRLVHPTEELDMEAQVVRRPREVWTGWEVAQAVTMMLTVITFILSAATMAAVNHRQ